MHYVIGDVHGGLVGLDAMLAALNPSASDTIYFIGDLVGKGADDWGVLRRVRELPGAQIILGNHDLCFLRRWYDAAMAQTLTVDQQLSYAMLRNAALAKWHPTTDTLMVHAGIWPGWQVRQVLALASEVEAVLRDDDMFKGYVQHFYGNEDVWQANLTGWRRVRCIVNILTRMRMLDANQHMCFHYTGPADFQAQLVQEAQDDQVPTSLTPWYECQKSWPCQQIVFGHWAMLKGHTGRADIINIDGGYVYGGTLIAYHLQTKERTVVKSPQA